jgi:K+-transporting ATPase KdpF subunit
MSSFLPWESVHSLPFRPTRCFAITSSEIVMLDMILGGATAASLFGYLLFALLRPESL